MEIKIFREVTDIKFIIREKMFTFSDKFTIKNETGEDCYFVWGEILCIGNKLHFEDKNGKEIFYIEQKLFTLLSEYDVYQNGELIAKIKRKFSFKPKFDIWGKFGEYELKGNIWAHEFSIEKDDMPVATVSKEWFTWTDTYGIDIFYDDNQDFIIALVIIIDQSIYDKNK
ncbi:MAG: hypothetical protein PWQ77_1446 [Kosmotogales bacterium]|nr:hypothetical protein [Kosmotogales bacterium]